MNLNKSDIIQVTREFFQVGGNQLTSSGDAAIYLINFDGHAAIVDAGCGTAQDRLIANTKACGVDLAQIEYLLLTHCNFDHTGGAKALKDLLQFYEILNSGISGKGNT